VMTLPVSGVRFVALFPRPTLEFFLEGHRRAFRFLGGVPGNNGGNLYRVTERKCTTLGWSIVIADGGVHQDMGFRV